MYPGGGGRGGPQCAVPPWLGARRWRGRCTTHADGPWASRAYRPPGCRGRRAEPPAAVVGAGAARRNPPGQAFRRLPERRDRTRHPAGIARRLPLGRTREALHHQRHGDGPGQDVQRHRSGPAGGLDRQADPRGRHDHVPPAFHARHLRRHRGSRPRLAVGPGAQDPDALLARGERRGFRGRRPMEASVVFPPSGRGHSRRRGA